MEKKQVVKLDPVTMELTVGLSATIATGSYENISPLYSLKQVVQEGTDLNLEIDGMKSLLYSKLSDDYARVKTLMLEKNTDLRFYEMNGKKYPSVTTVINMEGISFPKEKLAQYASRGNIVHELADHFLNTGELVKPEELPALKEDLIILNNGSLKLKYDDVSFIGFMEKYKDEITWDKEPCESVFNDDFLYAGLPDRIGTYKGKKALFDFKTTSNYDKKKLAKYFKQLAAYNKCGINADYLIIVPLSNKDKDGFLKPFVEEDTEKHFAEFLNDRRTFKKVYGI